MFLDHLRFRDQEAYSLNWFTRQPASAPSTQKGTRAVSRHADALLDSAETIPVRTAGFHLPAVRCRPKMFHK